MRITYVIPDRQEAAHYVFQLGRVSMSNRDNRAYYSRRADEEIQRGDDASTILAATVHYELAYRYSLKAAQSITKIPKLILIQGHRIKLPEFGHLASTQNAGEVLHGVNG